MCMNFQGNSTGKTVLKKNQAGGLLIPDFRTWGKATVIKTVETSQSNGWQKLTQNERAKTMKLLEAKMEVNLHHLGFGTGFLDVAPKA